MRSHLKKVLFLSGIAMVLLISGCGNDRSNRNQDASEFKPGSLRLTKIEGISKSAAFAPQNAPSSAATITTTFDFGTIKSSQDFYFLLSNAGDSPVTNITVTTSNINYVVSPGTIDAVAPQSQSLVTPVVKIRVIHGVALNGIGYTSSLLSMGSNTCTLTITGTTTDSSGNAIPLSYDIQLNVFAEVMDISVAGIDLTPRMFAQSPISSDVPAYHADAVTITNTGNVDISINDMYCDTNLNFAVIDSVTLHPNESRQMSYPTDTIGSKCIYLKIESNNTIADYSKLHFKPDGTLWLQFTNII